MLVSFTHGVEEAIVVLLFGPRLVAVGTCRGNIGRIGQGLPLYCNGGCGSDVLGADGRGESGWGYRLVWINCSTAFQDN